jgi:hypothetical protein
MLKLAEEMNNNVFRITDKLYYENQSDYVEKKLGLTHINN